jgi:hypothetical protein
MLAALMTFAHLSVSAAIISAAAGVPRMGVT